MRPCFLIESVLGENSIFATAWWSDVKQGPNIWKTYYHKDIPRTYTFYTSYI